MISSTQIDKIAPALLKAQRVMGSATKGAANPYFKSRYADLGAVMEVAKDPLNEVGIMILQPAYSRDGSHYVETVLMHESGQFVATEPLKLELTKVDMQSLGSAITYSRRYQLQSLLSIPAEDDDGEKSMTRTPKTTSRPATTTSNIIGGTSTTVLTTPVELTSSTNGMLPPNVTVVNAVPVEEAPKARTTFRGRTQSSPATTTTVTHPVTSSNLNF